MQIKSEILIEHLQGIRELAYAIRTNYQQDAVTVNRTVPQNHDILQQAKLTSIIICVDDMIAALDSKQLRNAKPKNALRQGVKMTTEQKGK